MTLGYHNQLIVVHVFHLHHQQPKHQHQHHQQAMILVDVGLVQQGSPIGLTLVCHLPPVVINALVCHHLPVKLLKHQHLHQQQKHQQPLHQHQVMILVDVGLVQQGSPIGLTLVCLLLQVVMHVLAYHHLPVKQPTHHHLLQQQKHQHLLQQVIHVDVGPAHLVTPIGLMPVCHLLQVVMHVLV